MTFSKMGFRFTDEDVDAIINNKPLAIENALRILKVKIEMHIRQKYEKRGNQYALQLQEHSGGSGGPSGSPHPQPVKHDGELPQIHQKGATKAKVRSSRPV
jgi:hypothetical protein